MDWACSTYKEKRGMYRVLVWKPNGKRTFGRPGRRWGYNITMDFRKLFLGVLTGLTCRRTGTVRPHLRKQ